MLSKSIQGQTKKYSNVVKSVKDTQKPEEPKISLEQVVSAFQSFGFEPNERNQNDIGFWTTRPVSEGSKLMEELRKRRMDENQREDDVKKGDEDKQKSERDFNDKQEQARKNLLQQQTMDKIVMPRLSDEDLKSLFDEYGLPSQDAEWSRNHLPNNPKMIRNILSLQRKTADDMMKKEAKNTVNAVPETPKMSGAPMASAPAPMMGMGGPNPMGNQGGMIPNDSPVTPFFVGNHSLIRITNPNNPNSGTLWLADKKKKTLQPISSERDIENMFDDPEAAMNSITTVSSQALAPGGPLEGFTPLDQEKGIQEDGSIPNIEFSPAQLKSHYNKSEDIAGENKSLSILDGLFGKMSTQPNL